MKAFKHCQSCGMPLDKDELGGGTELDGSYSSLYCSHCYINGKFTNAELTVSDMQALVKQKMRQMNLPAPLIWWFTRGISKLRRWRKDG